ncbi:thermonuclease family protein [Sporosarcina aquimarina]|uniref:Thermonuclease family protein n=1 Tax=Sporosarcina aquimarina TaxID=114975 RepID=A0ABU4G1D5_9BACL|nr:thermonuclease family protein [Sporosarcina aquimarina]MDW0110200.1 thermonuclease family protein [Sporosarcina aquimarina]
MAHRTKKSGKTKGSLSAILVAILLAGAYYFLFDEQDTTPTRDGLIPVELVKTIDGDTIKIMYEGKETNVRYLLIDTPETNHPRLGKQPFGEEAKRRNQELMNSGKLEIEFDIGQKYDKYDRLLAYIYIDGESVQEKLLSEGLARVAYVYPPNTRHVDEYEKIQNEAKKKGIGIWTLEDYATDRGFDSDTYPIKGNSTSKPSTKNPTKQPSEKFANCTELRKVYPNGVKKGHAAYSEQMDGDKDGVACEPR